LLMTDYSQSIVLIPTLNEVGNLQNLIPAIFKSMPDISVLVVDDNSNDGTEGYLNSIKTQYPNLFLLTRQKNLGYGNACIDGFKWVLGHDFKCVVTMDADFSHDYKAIPSLLDNLVDGDVVIGSRYVSGGKIENWKLHRRILSKVANFYVRLILQTNISDFTTGFNAYRKEAIQKINLNGIKSDGYAFLVEFKYKLSKSGAKIVEFPITFSERREGQSKMSGKIIWESIKLPWRLRF